MRIVTPQEVANQTQNKYLGVLVAARFGYSVSATTRKPRPGEQDGEAYHFLTHMEFERREAAG